MSILFSILSNLASCILLGSMHVSLKFSSALWSICICLFDLWGGKLALFRRIKSWLVYKSLLILFHFCISGLLISSFSVNFVSFLFLISSCIIF